MAKGWTPERRARQAELICTWRPWERSTGPTTADGKAVASGNAWKGGRLSKLREMKRVVNAEIRQARDLVDSVR